MTSADLYAALAELMARWRRAVPGEGGTIMDLMKWSWSSQQPTELHSKLDRLCAEWAIHNSGLRVQGRQMKPKLFSNTPAAELLEWSRRQSKE